MPTTITQNDARSDGLAAESHPKGLLTLATTELWERLSFYGLQVIVAYYIYYSVTEGGLGLTEAQALAIVGAYGGGVYLMQPLGAWLADRLVPVRYVVAASGCLIMAGHIVLAIVPELFGLLLGLVLITLGTGGLFPNILAMLGQLYADKPLNRDSGFALYYTGIMLGALAGPLLTGYLQVNVGFHVAFSAAAVGMGIGLLVYFARWRTLPKGAASVPNPLSARGKLTALIVCILVVAAVGGVAGSNVVGLSNINTIVLLLISAVSIAYFAVMANSKSLDRGERNRVIAFIPLYLAAILFWTMVLQLFTTFAVYADTRVDLTIGSFVMPPAYISTFEVAAGIITGPLIAAGWKRLGGKQPGSAMKMVIGLVVMAVAYAVFALLPVLTSDQVGLVPVVLGMFLFGIAEVTFAPIAFSAATQLAPQVFYSQMVALSGLALGAGASLSGFVGQLYDASYEAVFFGSISLCILLAALILLALRSPLRRCGL